MEPLVLDLPDVSGDGVVLAPPVAAPAPRHVISSRLPQKAPRADLRRQYRLTIEVGLVLALAVVLGLMQLDIRQGAAFQGVVVEQEVVQMEEIQQTRQELKPPPPPRPQAPVAVSDEVVIDENIELNLDATLDVEAALPTLPPPPPPPEEPVPETEADEKEVFVVVEQMPELIGGIASIQQHIVYPEVARLAGISGKVIVQFVVDETGRVRDPVVLRGIGGGCDEEAIRAVLLARFKPGRQRGKAVRVRYVLPITFRLK